MNKYKIISKDHSDTIIEADYIMSSICGGTLFYRNPSTLIGNASKDSVVVIYELQLIS